jgi:hypothetical protein
VTSVEASGSGSRTGREVTRVVCTSRLFMWALARPFSPGCYSMDIRTREPGVSVCRACEGAANT